MWALLALYELLRTVMVEAAESRPGTDPDRCSFTIAFRTARDHVIHASGIISHTTTIGVIGAQTLVDLLPPRRPRVSIRKVKSPISRYNERFPDGGSNTSHTVTHLAITVIEPPPDQPPLPTTSRDDRYSSPADRRSVTALACFSNAPAAPGVPATWPVTSATSPCTPCTGNSSAGPPPDSSAKPAPPATPPTTTRRRR
ncbi:hypothetical protein OHA77_17220 [Streptosporangium sp. NBC_01639]|uniref:hypothetical protein n=1 Tax=Streptosporangium sp. NBC_01639 TaxID=2975948 RepID=UPI003869BF3B|nr:hypothetical protein OHA77_17220 [Streptosporangium sp. NBC_01639]